MNCLKASTGKSSFGLTWNAVHAFYSIVLARPKTSILLRPSYASLRQHSASAAPSSYEQASSSGSTLPFALQTSLVVARAPLLTTLPTTFESEYYEYQSRLHRALSQPFPANFYFKKGTLLERRFNAEERAREMAAFGEGFGAAVEGDERLEDIPSDEEAVTFLPRETEADRSNNFKSLNRRGERTLYLLVKPLKSKAASGAWEFPTWEVGSTQPLHTVRTFLSTYVRNFDSHHII